MSRIGNKPVPILSGVTVDVTGAAVSVQGPKGKLSWTLPRPITAAIKDGQVVVTRPSDEAGDKALHGLSRALIANMIKGCAQGYSRGLEIYGTGFGVSVEGKNLMINVGFMGRGVGRKAQFIVPIPEGIVVKVDVPAARGNNEPAKFTISGPDKQQVSQFASEIRKIRKPEPYLGKGIRYAGEQVRRKAGKVFAGGGG